MNMIFVLTFKGSIEKWESEGIANREMELCISYLKNDLFEKIIIYSYGHNDREFLNNLNYDSSLLSRIDLIVPDKKLVSYLDYLMHSLSITKIRYALENNVGICRTNQINGAWTALLIRLLGCPLLLRCGYILSRRLFINGNYLKGLIALTIEAIVIIGASKISVTTKDAVEYFSKVVPFCRKKIFVAPTYVNTEIFSPSEKASDEKQERAIFVGRLEKQKNIFPMIEACSRLKLPLTIIGKGSLQSQLIALIENSNLDVLYIPNMSNEEIANLYKKHKYFILPSLQEGLPKVLIEAMSSEMICIGTPTSGIIDLIFPNETGYLTSGFNANEITLTLSVAMNDPEATKYAKNARRYALANHSISSYMHREYQNIKPYIKL